MRMCLLQHDTTQKPGSQPKTHARPSSLTLCKGESLEVAIVDGSREGNNIADITHSGNIHDQPLKAKPKPGMAGRTILTEI